MISAGAAGVGRVRAAGHGDGRPVSKLIYKAADSNVYVASVPTHEFTPKPSYDDFLNLSDVLAVLGELRCSMYDNALIPVALANRLVSLSDFPSKRILEVFARERVQSQG